MTLIKKILIQTAIVFLVWGFICGLVFWLHPDASMLMSGEREALPLSEGEIRVEDAVRLAELEDVMWVDVRSREQFARESIEGALNLPYDIAPDALSDLLFEWIAGGQLGMETIMILYCGSTSCDSSHNMRTRLIGEEIGNQIKDIKVLAGGWQEWRRWKATEGRTARTR